MTRTSAFLFLIQLFGLALSFSNERLQPRRYDTSVSLFGGGGGVSKLPSPNGRDKQAIDSIKAAISKPRNPSFPLVECEFPPLEALNKLGDGSQRSADQVDSANFAFAAKLVKSLSGIPFLGPNVYLFLSAASSSRTISKAKSIIKGATYVGSLKDRIPDTFKTGDVVVVVAPCIGPDYSIASQLAKDGIASGVVIINGLAKSAKSVSGSATMAYYLKPLTYNSQVVGYLCRNYPNDWATVDLLSKQVLKSYKDEEILFGDSNAPDLRGPGFLVQKCVDERAIQSRKN
ncbi:unnamed protein product [Cylindrotheca closterium]|uniref:DUF1995 domain-containing protein n=1 Tax=Cylindrotheca closterium TaxID=2856 RepID=A0AAD2FCB1_9STRA|nr:unnamed protein product [Cylindrotheca closterium]